MTSDEIMLGVILDTAAWIDRHLDRPLEIRAVTQKSGYTHWHFQRQFHLITGIPIAKYIRLRRLQWAGRELAASDRALEAIAPYCRLGSAQAMNRIFRRYTGLTPGGFRAAYQGRISDAERQLQRLMAGTRFYLAHRDGSDALQPSATCRSEEEK